MSQDPLQIAMIDPHHLVSKDDAESVAAAVTRQIQHDLARYWAVTGSVHFFSNAENVPSGSALIQLVPTTDKNQFGYHSLDGQQPVAFVEAPQNGRLWSLTVSHEALEMTVDRWGNYCVPGTSPDGQRQVQYLVEICDPCQSPSAGYSIDGWLMSEFVLQSYYSPAATQGPFSINGRVPAPRGLLPGGYISWLDPTMGDSWFSKSMDDEGVASTRQLGAAPIDASMRAWVDRQTGSSRRHHTASSDIVQRLDQDRERVVASGRIMVSESMRYWRELIGS